MRTSTVVGVAGAGALSLLSLGAGVVSPMDASTADAAPAPAQTVAAAVKTAAALGLPGAVVAQPTTVRLHGTDGSVNQTVDLSNSALVAKLLADPNTTDAQRQFLQSLATQATVSGDKSVGTAPSGGVTAMSSPGCGTGGSGSWDCVYYMHSECSRFGAVEDYLDDWTGMSGNYKQVTNVAYPSLGWDQQTGWTQNGYPTINQGYGANNSNGWTNVYSSWTFLYFGYTQTHFHSVTVQPDSSYDMTFNVSCP